MYSQKELEHLLDKIEGKSYGAYKEIKGTYQFTSHQLAIDHVQADPFAGPSQLRIIIDKKVHKIPEELYDCRDKKVALADFLTRTFRKNIFTCYNGVGGSGKSGLLTIDDCGQQIVERTSVLIDQLYLEVRFQVGLPAAGRRILGKLAKEILCNVIPQIIKKSLIYENLPQEALQQHLTLYLNQQRIRKQLKDKKLVAFIGNGAILPREDGISDRPLKKDVTRFQSPSHLEVSCELIDGTTVTGMGIPRGVTLIVGGGYHGKSTLLKALERGVYNHIAGDGREYVLTDTTAMKIRAEDGRSITRVNISPFINHLPNHKETKVFETQNASGSTSQAANTIEALEAGTRCLLIDEDTSATNFMIRDKRMQQLVKKEKEPITPFVEKIRPLYESHEVSTILVVGGSGEYFDVADLVLMMDEYIPLDVTQRAHEIAGSNDRRCGKASKEFGEISKRIPLKKSLKIEGKEGQIKVRNKDCITLGKVGINLDFMEQLLDEYQTYALATMIDYLRENKIDDKRTLTTLIDTLYERIEREGMKCLLKDNHSNYNLALPRKQELYGVFNRYRLLEIKE